VHIFIYFEKIYFNYDTKKNIISSLELRVYDDRIHYKDNTHYFRGPITMINVFLISYFN